MSKHRVAPADSPGPRPGMWSQFRLLLSKNLAVKRSNRQSTIIQILVPVIVNFVLFMITVEDKFNPEGHNKRTWQGSCRAAPGCCPSAAPTDPVW